jgi:hypothetical protein
MEFDIAAVVGKQVRFARVFAITSVFPAGRLFGRISQKGPKRGRTSRKCILTSLFTHILGKSKKYYTFATYIDKDNFCV